MFRKLIMPLIFVLMLASAYAEDSCNVSNGCAVIGTTDSDFIFTASNETYVDHVCLVYFYSPVCSSCAETAPFMAELEDKYEGLVMFHKYNVMDKSGEGIRLYSKLCSMQSISSEDKKIPMVGIGNDILIGPDAIKNNLEDKIIYYLQQDKKPCPLPGELSCSLTNYTIDTNNTFPLIPGITGDVTLPLVLGAGIVDGINPCAFAVMIFFVSYLISVSSSKRKIIKAGVAYTASVYITYLLAGLGLLSVIQISGISGVIYQIAALVALFVGAVNIKDYFWYGKGFTFKIPESRKPTIRNLTQKANLPAAIILGFLVSMFELPCTGGVYLTILAMLATSTTSAVAFSYLLVYNLMFIAPLVILLFILLRGMSAEKLENWRKEKRNWMKLATGVLLVVLGLGMLFRLF